MQQATQTTKKPTNEILLSENQQAIIALLREDGRMKRDILSERIKVSEKTISSNIKILKDLGLIVRIGSKKEGKWKVIIGWQIGDR
jgi:predicted HTH transcriptional regulator